jgi:hypothetical protein
MTIILVIYEICYLSNNRFLPKKLSIFLLLDTILHVKYSSLSFHTCPLGVVAPHPHALLQVRRDPPSPAALWASLDGTLELLPEKNDCLDVAC